MPAVQRLAAGWEAAALANGRPLILYVLRLPPGHNHLDSVFSMISESECVLYPPVFTPYGLPGVARLLGPTGGYLLAYPFAAYAVGRLTGDGRRWTRVALAVLAGLALIHLGGLVQLGILTGSLSDAARFGTLPFLVSDLLKLAIAVLILRPSVSPLRARL